MIILLNGPFGIGKTTTAKILNEKIENSIIYDPEEVGGMLQKIVIEEIKHPNEKTGDFQDIIIWKELVVLIAKKMIDVYNKNLIIPMTIYNLEYFEYIWDELKKIDCQIYHFCLLAQKATIEKRSLKRGEKMGSWPFKQIDKCLSSFEHNVNLFNPVIYTDELSVEEVTSHILKTVTKS